MIENFEEITEELSEEEKKLIPILIKGFLAHNKNNPIKSKDICEAINNKRVLYGLKRQFNGVRLRKITNYIRSNGILPLIATSDGYYTSNDTSEIKKQIESLKQRANAILNSATGLEIFIN